MAISEPIDVLDGFPGWCTEFALQARQEQSRHAGGRTRVKNLGPPLWRATYVSRPLVPSVLDRWRAQLNLLETDQLTFYGRPLSRCRPIEHPGSASLPTGSVDTINANNKAIKVDGLTGITLSVGDYLQIDDSLYQVQEDATAVAGLTPLFEIRPHLWTGVATSDDVIIDSPSCLMTVVPGSVSASADSRTGRGSISWQAIEAR